MFDDPVFYDGAGGLIRTVLSAAMLYIAVIVAVRVFGKRSTSQMNNFDWIVTVAIGSLMASGVLLSDVTVFESVAAIYVLFALQWSLTKIMLNSDIFTKIVKSEPTLIVHKGKILLGAMKQERLSEAEIHAAVRGAGLSRIEDVQWIILETNSSLSVIPATEPLQGADMLEYVGGVDEFLRNDS